MDKKFFLRRKNSTLNKQVNQFHEFFLATIVCYIYQVYFTALEFFPQIFVPKFLESSVGIFEVWENMGKGYWSFFNFSWGEFRYHGKQVVESQAVDEIF